MLKNKGHYKCMHSSCRYMEEVIESTFSLLSSNHDHCSQRAEKTLEPVHLLALLDIEATWFKKWMVRPFVFSTSSLLVSFCFRLLRPLLVFPPRLHLSARILQQDGGSQTPREKVQVSGERLGRRSMRLSRISLYFRRADGEEIQTSQNKDERAFLRSV